MFENRVLVLDPSTQGLLCDIESAGFRKYLHAVEDLRTSMSIPPMVKISPCLILDETSFIFDSEEIMEYLQKVYDVDNS